jgi:hypothetical protein
VIRHQAVSVDPDVELDGIVFQPIKVSFVVVIATKRFSSLIAMHDDMVKQAWRKDSGRRAMGREVSRFTRHD